MPETKSSIGKIVWNVLSQPEVQSAICVWALIGGVCVYLAHTYAAGI